MNCLHCGDCCLRMSPLSAPDPCPNVVTLGSYYLCGDYENRPEECVNHTFHATHCPVGLTKLDIVSPDKLRERIDNGWGLIKSL